MLRFVPEKFGIQYDLAGLKALYYSAKTALEDLYREDKHPSDGCWVAESSYYLESVDDVPDSVKKGKDYNRVTVYFVLLSDYDITSKNPKASDSEIDDYWDNVLDALQRKNHSLRWETLISSEGFCSSRNVVVKIRTSDFYTYFSTRGNDADREVIKTLQHEMVHAFDELHWEGDSPMSQDDMRRGQANNMRPLEDTKDKEMFSKALYLLYCLWVDTEFNAWQVGAINDLGGDASQNFRKQTVTSDFSTELPNVIRNLDAYAQDDFWSYLKTYMVNNAESSNVSKLEKMSVESFKAWFINGSKDRLDRLIRDASKKHHLSREQEKANNALADAIEEQLKQKRYPSNAKSCNIKVSVSHYFRDLSYAYPIDLEFNWSNVLSYANYTPIKDFNQTGKVTMSVRKVHFQSTVTFADLTNSANNQAFYYAFTFLQRDYIEVVASLLNKMLDSVVK